MKTSTVMATGMSGLLLAGLVGTAVPAMAADSSTAAVGDSSVSAAVAGKTYQKSRVVNFHANKENSTPGQTIKLRGRVAHNHHRHTRVVIQKQLDSGNWKKVSKTFTKRNGHFVAKKAFRHDGDFTLRAKSQGRHFSEEIGVSVASPTPPDNSQIYVTAGDTQALLDAINTAPDGATLYLNGTYNVTTTTDASGWDAGVVIGKNLTLAGGTIQSDGTDNVISVHKGVTLTLDDGINITGGYAGQGGGIWNLGTVVVNDAYIWGNEADQGAGVYNKAGATFTLNGGRIDKNTANIAGGGIDNKGTVYLNDGAITQNTSKGNYGGIVSDGQVFNADGQLITSSPLVFDNSTDIWG
ncbi:MAG: hypothetical protein K0U60_00440 [Actinomycetia bacterium]|nr:hypothetical protein [Actinomycetes bacterium]